MGYAKDTNNARSMARCARRLRQPPDRGAGVDKRGFDNNSIYLETRAVPMEFTMLDEFLNNIVGPTL